MDEQNEFIERFQIRKGDVLITRANTKELVGRVCLVEADFPNLMLSDKTLKLELKSDLIENVFLAEILKSGEARKQIEAFATGTGGAMKNISQSEIESIEIPFPDKRIQFDLSKRLMQIKDNRNNLKTAIEKATSLQKALINQIF